MQEEIYCELAKILISYGNVHLNSSINRIRIFEKIFHLLNDKCNYLVLTKRPEYWKDVYFSFENNVDYNTKNIFDDTNPDLIVFHMENPHCKKCKKKGRFEYINCCGQICKECLYNFACPICFRRIVFNFKPLFNVSYTREMDDIIIKTSNVNCFIATIFYTILSLYKFEDSIRIPLIEIRKFPLKFLCVRSKTEMSRQILDIDTLFVYNMDECGEFSYSSSL